MKDTVHECAVKIGFEPDAGRRAFRLPAHGFRFFSVESRGSGSANRYRISFVPRTIPNSSRAIFSCNTGSVRTAFR